VARVRRQLDEGCPPFWTCTFAVVRQRDQRIVGGCGFKGAPVNGRVEIGYGISAACRREGAATAAVGRLLSLAFAAGATAVLAQVLPDNVASTGVLWKHGFRNTGTQVDPDGTVVVEWVASRGA
jgi:RimJ/RimL family protein N-acetyltransferase